MKKINWKYTFGEILIVIIGITIAFSMNKCAENKKDNNLKKQYLTNIQKDVLADKEILESNITTLQQKIKIADDILPKLNTEAPDKMSIVGKIFNIVSVVDFTPNNITYQTLINSGDLKLISDFAIKTAIEKHYANYKAMQKSYLRLENIQKEYVGNYFIHETDYEAFGKREFGFKNEKLLKNIIISMRGAFDLKLKATQMGVKSCDNLLKTLDSIN